MKKRYSSPELDMIKLKMTADILVLSDPESSENSGVNSNGPSPDPFGDIDLNP